MHSRQIPLNAAIEFLTAGHAIFTLKSIKSGKHLTFQITAPDDADRENPKILFVSVKTGTEEFAYTYIGTLRRNPMQQWIYNYGLKSKISEDANSVKVLNWLVNNILFNGFFDDKQSELWHEGKCCRCGRDLTVPHSIESGIGPECSKIKFRALNKEQRAQLREAQKQNTLI